MARGGIFLAYNKVLPGAYINFISKTRSLGSISDRGVVAIAMKMSWGAENSIVSITSEDFQKNALPTFGYSYSSEQLLPIREIFQNASELKFYRLGTGNKASVTIDSLTISAIYGGTRGNDIKIKVSKNLDDNNFTVYTYIDTNLVDEQDVSDASELLPNSFVTFYGTGIPSANAGINLSGGTDDITNNEEYSKFLDVIETESFNILIYDGKDEITKGLFTNFTKRLRDDEGVKFITVLHDYTKADYEGVVSLKNSRELIYWLGGALACIKINESLTNKTYNGELVFDAKFSNSELKEAINNGEIVFYYDDGDCKILKDINTFTSFTTDKNSDFSNTQVIRILDSTANDIARIFNDYYLGKMQNDMLGRDIFRAEVITYFRELQALRAIDNFDDNDVKIYKGTEKGDVILDVLIEPIACMDKLYMKCVIE